MAKIYGLFGTMKGKVADVVMAVRNGEQVVRKYQPIVSNPSTTAQVEARAKLKLMSQLSAVFAPVIAIPRVGAVSPRNLFVKANYANATYSNNQAQINYSGLQITKSVVGVPGITASRSDGVISVSLASGTSAIDRMVYTVFAINPDNTIRFVGSAVATESGVNNIWSSSVPDGGAGSTTAFLVYAYGVKDLTEFARANYGDMIAESAEAFAKLIVQRSLTENDIQLTETKYAEVTGSTQSTTVHNTSD